MLPSVKCFNVRCRCCVLSWLRVLVVAYMYRPCRHRRGTKHSAAVCCAHSLSWPLAWPYFFFIKRKSVFCLKQACTRQWPQKQLLPLPQVSNTESMTQRLLDIIPAYFESLTFHFLQVAKQALKPTQSDLLLCYAQEVVLSGICSTIGQNF